MLRWLVTKTSIQRLVAEWLLVVGVQAGGDQPSGLFQKQLSDLFFPCQGTSVYLSSCQLTQVRTVLLQDVLCIDILSRLEVTQLKKKEKKNKVIKRHCYFEFSRL